MLYIKRVNEIVSVFYGCVEELKYGKMVLLGQQGAFTQWDGVLKRKVSWLNICASNFVHIRFLIQAVYNTILRPEN